MALLQMPLSDFWDYTPREIDYALQAYHNQKLEESKTDWERTRTSIYYSYLLVPSKKRKVSYEQFKRNYLKLSWDDEGKENTEVIDDEAFASIHEHFKKLKGSGES